VFLVAPAPTAMCPPLPSGNPPSVRRLLPGRFTVRGSLAGRLPSSRPSSWSPGHSPRNGDRRRPRLHRRRRGHPAGRAIGHRRTARVPRGRRRVFRLPGGQDGGPRSLVALYEQVVGPVPRAPPTGRTWIVLRGRPGNTRARSSQRRESGVAGPSPATLVAVGPPRIADQLASQRDRWPGLYASFDDFDHANRDQLRKRETWSAIKGRSNLPPRRRTAQAAGPTCGGRRGRITRSRGCGSARGVAPDGYGAVDDAGQSKYTARVFSCLFGGQACWHCGASGPVTDRHYELPIGFRGRAGRRRRPTATRSTCRSTNVGREHQPRRRRGCSRSSSYESAAAGAGGDARTAVRRVSPASSTERIGQVTKVSWPNAHYIPRSAFQASAGWCCGHNLHRHAAPSPVADPG